MVDEEMTRLDDLRQSLQDIVDVANISSGAAWYAHVARKALDDDDKAKKAVHKVWTGPDLQRLFNAWRAGDDIDSLSKRFGRTPNAIRQQLHKAKVRRTSEKLRQIRLIARQGRIK
jgi:hypothetical protein